MGLGVQSDREALFVSNKEFMNSIISTDRKGSFENKLRPQAHEPDRKAHEILND